MSQDDEIFCNPVMAKSRMVPLNLMLLPKIYLTAATLAVKIFVQF